jgi:hypothetical protein
VKGISSVILFKDLTMVFAPDPFRYKWITWIVLLITGKYCKYRMHNEVKWYYIFLYFLIGEKLTDILSWHISIRWFIFESDVGQPIPVELRSLFCLNVESIQWKICSKSSNTSADLLPDHTYRDRCVVVSVFAVTSSIILIDYVSSLLCSPFFST